MRKRKRAVERPVSIGEILSTRSKGFYQGDLLHLYRIQKNWEGWVGKDLAKRTFPKDLKSKTLVISVENPAWAHELSMISEQILERIVEKHGRELTKLQFVTEKLSTQPPRSPVIVDSESVERSLQRLRKLQDALLKNSDDKI